MRRIFRDAGRVFTACASGRSSGVGGGQGSSTVGGVWLRDLSNLHAPREGASCVPRSIPPGAVASASAIAGTVHPRTRATAAPTTAQLRTLFVHSAVPFVAFGFVDNTVLIHMGDVIDTTFGLYFGLPTLAAAAIGQVFSDTTGVLFGSSIEALATRLGLPVPNLSVAQRALREAKFTSTAGAVVGVITGCCLGMINLLFIDLGSSERQRQAAELKGARERGASDDSFPSTGRLCGYPRLDEGVTVTAACVCDLIFPQTIFTSIMQQGHQVAECEKASLFIVDDDRRHLWSVNDADLRIPWGLGFAGAAATTGETVHVEHAPTDARFFPAVDARTGVATRNIIAMPVKNIHGNVVAVAEFRNKNHGRAFTPTDEKLLRMLCQNVAVFLDSMKHKSA